MNGMLIIVKVDVVGEEPGYKLPRFAVIKMDRTAARYLSERFMQFYSARHGANELQSLALEQSMCTWLAPTTELPISAAIPLGDFTVAGDDVTYPPEIVVHVDDCMDVGAGSVRWRGTIRGTKAIATTRALPQQLIEGMTKK